MCSAPRNHIPSSIQSLVDVSEALIRRKDSEPVISPSYSLRFCHLTTNPPNKTTVDIDPRKIEMLKMIFSFNGNPSSDREVKICLRPNTRRVYSEPMYRFLEGLTRDEAREVLSSRRIPAEKVAQVLDSYEEDPVAFRMISDGAELEIIFREGQVVTATSIKRGVEPILTDCRGLAICRLLITEAEAKKKGLIKMPFPLSDFCGTRVPESQKEIEEWLGKIASDLAKRAKPDKR